MSICFCQMVIFSLAVDGSGMKHLLSLPSDAEIMNIKGFFPVSILRFKVEVSIIEFEDLVAREMIFFCVKGYN